MVLEIEVWLSVTGNDIPNVNDSLSLEIQIFWKEGYNPLRGLNVEHASSPRVYCISDRFEAR